MHVSDGILPLEICVAGYALAIGGAVWCGRKLDTEEVPRMGLLAAAVFVASLVNVPIAGVSMHFGLFGLLGLLLGRRSVPVLFAVLILQTFLFQHGGFLSLGVNVANMASGALAAMAIGRLSLLPLSLRAGLAGFIGIFVPSSLLLGEFHLAGYGRSVMLLASVYALVGLAEGVFTVAVILFLQRTKPAVLGALVSRVLPAGESPAAMLARGVVAKES